MITLRIGDEKLSYHLPKAIRNFLDLDDTCYYLYVTDELVDEYMQKIVHLDPFEGWLEQEVNKKASLAGKNKMDQLRDC